MNSKRASMGHLAVISAVWLLSGPATAAERQPPPLAVAPFDAAEAKRHQQAWAEHLGVPLEITNSIGMKLVLIPPGQFLMGSSISPAEVQRRFPAGQVEWYESEHPRHSVRITRPYYLGIHEVTVGQFERFISGTGYRTTAEVVGTAWGYLNGELKESPGLHWQNPRFRQTSTHPVTCVSWDDAAAFCEWLRGEDGRDVRLPTEAEWEYACRAGTETLFFWGNDPDDGEGYLNLADLTGAPDGREWTFGVNFRDGYTATSPVGQFKPNAFGLYDMLGNVSEWCSDWYGIRYYAESPMDDPTGPPARLGRAFRGGGWPNNAGICRSARRDWLKSANRHDSLGFRVAFSFADPFDSSDNRQDPSEDAPRQNASILEDVPRTAHEQSDSDAAGIAKSAVATSDEATAKQHQRAWAKHLSVPVELTNSIGMKLMLIPPGEFLMGSPREEFEDLANAYPDFIKILQREQPQHRVRITNAYYLGIYEVTQGEYQQVMGTNPSWFSRSGDGSEAVAGRDTRPFPVEWVSWDDAEEFCRRLSRLAAEQAAGRVYRLPTEAEWEHACRAGTVTPFHFGAELNGGQANCNGNLPMGTEELGPFLGRTTQVGSYTPNAFGLYDMHGNVWEWCSSRYEPYTAAPESDPTGAQVGAIRVHRGGCWAGYASFARSAFRCGGPPTELAQNIGFRVAVSQTSSELPEPQDAARPSAPTEALGWRAFGSGIWTIEHGGVLKGQGTGGWLGTEEEYDDFELDLEFRLAPNSNSGIFLRAWPEGPPSGKDFLEIQLLDDTSPKFTNVSPTQRTAAVFLTAAPAPPVRCTPEVWHLMTIQAEGPRVRVRYNGQQVLDVDLSRSHSRIPGHRRKSGRVGLQVFGGTVEFRNIAIRRFIEPQSPLDRR